LEFDAVICGGGAIGLALTRELSSEYRQVLLLEQHSSLGSETSARNSEVIHAGIYYPTGSLKHKYCISGKKLLYSYLNEKKIPYDRVGKLVVACCYDDISRLEALYHQANSNKVDDLEWLDQDEISILEPEVSCVAGFISRSTGIFDSHSFLQALSFDAEQNGVIIAQKHRLISAEIFRGLIKISIEGFESDPIYTKRFFNCSGLSAIDVLHKCKFGDRTVGYRYEYAKGSYFALSGSSPFKHLIYPIPENGGLGIHSTIDFNGKTKFGPNVDWMQIQLDEIDANYNVDSKLESVFKTSIVRYWPAVEHKTLTPDYAGFRPKLFIDNELFEDFKIVKENVGSNCTAVHFLGIESPGLTASLSIAKYFVE
tara:strand:- start:244 stop:1350 length:1107 start_codon:yes stop_codon:yes gene_type:complete